MIKRLYLALALLITTPILSAQSPEITPETPVTSAQLIQWLHSGDPRLIAWSATLAAQHHDIATITQMPALLQTSAAFQASTPIQRTATHAILDTLIQEQTPVNLPTIKAIAENFLAQAVILIARLPLQESQSVLHDWTLGSTGNWSSRVRSRVAAMLLAQSAHPDSRFVAETVASAEEDLQITISDRKSGSWVRPVRPCGDSLGGLVRGWPEVYNYDLTEDDTYSGAILLIELAGDRITYRRYPESKGYGSCNGVEPLDLITRHHLIAYWLGVKPRDMSWQPIEYASIVWTNPADYQQQLGAIVDTQHTRLKATVDTLAERGFFGIPAIPTPPGVAAGDRTLPRLIITIHCEIKPCPIDIK